VSQPDTNQLEARRPDVRTRTVLVAGFLLALLIAAVASFYASSHPDGLEFVAAETGFLDQAKDSPTAESPFADYGTKGVENARIGNGLAGAVGVVTVAGVTGVLFWGIRRRSTRSDDGASTTNVHRATGAE
jgi:cobalt/nickel transport protein